MSVFGKLITPAGSSSVAAPAAWDFIAEDLGFAMEMRSLGTTIRKFLPSGTVTIPLSASDFRRVRAASARLAAEAFAVMDVGVIRGKHKSVRSEKSLYSQS